MSRVDAADKVAGRALYAADIDLAGLCHAAVVRSPHPRARIVRIDAAEALALPGVLGVFAGTDFEERLFGRRVRDVPTLARGEARFLGERVAAVVAETREQAERAAARVRVVYEPQPAVVDAKAALDPGSPTVHEAPWSFPGAVAEPGSHNLQAKVEHGSRAAAEAALAAADHQVDQTYITPTGHQGYLEPQAAVAGVDPDGRIHVWIANKSPYALRRQLAAGFEVDPAGIEVHPVAIGGDFGGKGSPMDAPLCVELARAVGRPVKLVLRYGEDLTAANPRHPARIRVRLGCDASGRLLGLSVDSLLDGGAYAGFKPVPTVVPHGVEEPGRPYRIPAAHTLSRVAYTNTVPRGHMRAPGSPQAVFAFESALDELALKAGIDPLEMRRRNLLRSGEPDPYGQTFVEARGRETLEAAIRAYQALPAPAGMRHGMGVAIYDRSTPGGSTSLRLIAGAAGTIEVEVPFPEQGSGVHTVVREGLARALDLPPDRIRVRQVSTAGLPQDDGVGGSRVTASLSVAIGKAAAAWRRRSGPDPVLVLTEREDGGPFTSYCVQIAQVAVDPETGRVQVLELLSAVDVAGVINPQAHRMQLEGAAAMGYGFACLEDLQVVDGQVWAAGLGEFRLPTSADVPRFRTVLVEGGRGIGALNVKSAGELSNAPAAAAIANAVARATGVRIRELPITAERVYRSLREPVLA
ncbi:MAG TPA: xanthine dehydrogenase family protein molybdopterin-binding subunit [Candidatus Acidoferrales bacterium]|nr:xanthine dehydrogenase family protein molybdopterin-binding subunit [Candidatus Acidoferrales bacterium]